MHYKTLKNYLSRVFTNCRENGEWINFSCPLAPYSEEHNFKPDRSPSAGAITGKTGQVIWHCYTCKGAGPVVNLLGYLEKKTKVSYADIIAAIADSEELPDYEGRFTQHSLEALEPMEYPDIFEKIDKYPAASKYLADRGVSPTTATKLGLQYDPDGYRIVFPVKNKHGKIFGYTGRLILSDSDAPKIKDYYFQKSRFILGIEHWKIDQPTIIVEGLFGFAHLHEITKGRLFPYNIGAIMGSSASREQLDLLLHQGQPVYCMLDNDAAGRVGMFGKKIQADWSKKKIQEELEKGLTYQLKDHIPTFVPRWPTYDKDGRTLEKDDPDLLTYDELYTMISKSPMVL